MKAKVFSILALCLFGISAHAQLISQEIKPNGDPVEIQVPAGAAERQIEVWFVSPGNESMPISLTAEGPSSATVQVKAAFLGKSTARTTLLRTTGWQTIKLRQSGDSRERDKLTLKERTAAAHTLAASNELPFDSSLCGLMSDRDLRQFLQIIEMYIGRPITKEEFCSGSLDNPLVAPTPGPDVPQPSGAQATGVLHKDTCRAAGKSRYLVRALVDLSTVEPARFAEGFSVNIGMRAVGYRGCKSASIKPVSDGKFAPNPLLLMCSLGGGGFFGFGGSGESVNMVKWRARGPGKTTKIRVEDYVFYKNLMLTRSVLKGLNGGKATFELSNGTSMYSVCFSLSRTRQRRNGYP